MTRPFTVPQMNISHAVKHSFVLSALLLSVACSGQSESDAPIPSSDARADSVTLGAEAVAIAGFTVDSSRVVPWSTGIVAPARVMLNPSSEQTLGSIVEGRVTHVFVRVGDVVRQGQVLIAIHSHELMDARRGLTGAESQLRAARASHDAAQIALKRAERLLAAQAMSQADLERATVAAARATAELEEAEAEATRADGLMEHLLGVGPTPKGIDEHDVLIRAPIGGTVFHRSVTEGTVVLPGDPLVSVANPRALQLEMQLTDRQVTGVVRGTTLRFSLVGERAGSAIGTAIVSRVSPVAEENTRTVMVTADISNAPPGTRAERFATAEITGAAGEAVLRVPALAVQSLAGDTVVIVAEQRGDGLFIRATPVRIGRRTSEYVEVLSGITAGQAVIVKGAVIARAELLKRREGAGGE